MRPALLLLATGVLSACGANQTSVPRTWPLKGFEFPPGTHDVMLSPTDVDAAFDKLPKKRRFGTTPQRVETTTWSAFFRFDGSHERVFKYVELWAEKEKYVLTASRTDDMGRGQVARSASYVSPTGDQEVSVRYWQGSDSKKVRPYQLVVRKLP